MTMVIGGIFLLGFVSECFVFIVGVIATTIQLKVTTTLVIIH